MTFDEAVRMLRGAGMIVEVGESLELVACADPEDPPPVLRDQGVQTSYSFGFSLRRVDAVWFLHATPMKPAEQFELLDDAVFRGLKLLSQYRDHHSPRVYWDQFTVFNAVDPCPLVEGALVKAGWLAPQDHLAHLGLTFHNGAYFSLAFPHEKRIVTVCASPSGDGAWSLAIRCYRKAPSDSGSAVPIRMRNREGGPIPDPTAPNLSYRVALTVHVALVTASTNLRWAVHAEPTAAVSSMVPIMPTPA